MGMYDNQNRTTAVQARLEELSPKKGKRERSYVRSLLLIFIILAIAATVNDLRRPAVDTAQMNFSDLVYQQMEAQKADFWLGGMTEEALLAQDGWIIDSDSDPDTRRVAARLLDLPQTTFNDAPVLNWSGVKLEEAARLWELWQQQPEGQSELDFINGQLAQMQQNKTLPALGEDFWLLSDLYLVMVDGDTVGICPLSALKHLD